MDTPTTIDECMTTKCYICTHAKGHELYHGVVCGCETLKEMRLKENQA